MPILGSEEKGRRGGPYRTLIVNLTWRNGWIKLESLRTVQHPDCWNGVIVCLRLIYFLSLALSLSLSLTHTHTHTHIHNMLVCLFSLLPFPSLHASVLHALTFLKLLFIFKLTCHPWQLLHPLFFPNVWLLFFLFSSPTVATKMCHTC